jgi:hypothetical protein
MHNGNLADLFLAISLLTVFLLLTLTLLYLTEDRRIQRLRKTAIPSLLTEVEQHSDSLLAYDSSDHDPDQSHSSSVVISFPDHWSHLYATAVRLEEQIEQSLASWMHKYRRRPSGMHAVMTRLEATINRLASGLTVEDTDQLPHPTDVIHKLRQILNNLEQAERQGN